MQLKPHLGTTEYFNISLILSELILIERFKLDEITISKSYVSYLKMKARSSYDNNLIQDAIVNYNGTIEDHINAVSSIFTIAIGHMIIQLTIAHEINMIRTKVSSNNISNWDHHFYKRGYKETTININDIELNLSEQTVRSSIYFKNSQNKYSGVGSAYSTMNIANFILMAGQLIQILIYKLEGVRRDQSKNMWLRGLELFYSPYSFHLSSKAVATCQRFNTVLLRGEKWRVANLFVSMDTLSAKFNMTHQIL